MFAPSPSNTGLLSVSQACQLSQSAPCIMEPLLQSNTVIQARAHIQTRLRSSEFPVEQKGSFPAPPLNIPPRTPKLLAPLDGRSRDSIALQGFKPLSPLMPICQSPFPSRSHLRRKIQSWSNKRSGPHTCMAGSEESGSCSSSQSSIDLENEENDDERSLRVQTSEESHLKTIEGYLSRHLRDVSSCERETGENVHITNQIAPIHRSVCIESRAPISHFKNPLSTDETIKSYCKVKDSEVTHTKEPDSQSSLIKCNFDQQDDTVDHAEDTVNNDMRFTKSNVSGSTEAQTGIQLNHPRCGASSENGHQGVKQAETTMKSTSDEESAGANKSNADRPDLVTVKEVHNNVGVEKDHLLKPAIDLSEVEPRTGEKVITPIKSVQNHERGAYMNTKQRANIQTTNVLPHKDRSSHQWHKSKGKVRSAAVSLQVKPKLRKSPDLINTEATTASKVKSKVNSVRGTQHNMDTSTQMKVSELHHAKTNSDKLNKRTQQHPPVRQLKTARQLKRPGVTGPPRSKSALDLITYKDMFQTIQSGDDGPAIFEMFAGPVYDNLRVSSSCEKQNDRQVQSAPYRKKQQSNKVTPRPTKKQAEGVRLRKSPVQNAMVSAKSKQKPSRDKHRLKPCTVTTGNVNELDLQTANELALSKDGEICHDSARVKCGDHVLSTIEETRSQCESETVKPDNKMARSTLSSPDDDCCHHIVLPEPVLSQSPLQPKLNTWTSGRSSNYTMSPVYQRFLDDVGEGPLTDDLLQCLAEELISLDEKDTSMDLHTENSESTRGDSNRTNPAMKRNQFHETSTDGAKLHDSRLVKDDTITWTKGEVLGRGAYGTVYCGLTSLGQLIAVKQVRLDPSDLEAAEREYGRLQGEVELLKTLTHANIVGFLGTSLHQHVVSIVMEYIPGGSIASILHRFGPLPERILALYTHQILEGVAYLHLNRVIHRDLKGNNVMLMPTGIIKLIDFGCARRLTCFNHSASANGDLLKSVHGTPFWMAPEVINETGYGRKSDIWSVGCTVFEMATGKPPLAHMDKMAALFYIGARKGLMPSLPDGFSDYAKDFVDICLTSDPRLRPSAEHLLKHPLVHKKETGVNSWQSQRKDCCGHPEGLCA
ncbi:mitogen-activated protein kinase kinase kinase 19 [Genypterus blacodes]|uniref:mitogen-activated protein kinase kinase kinase 19 n=1 Tax=Genypterus blacodes TaxID=154954 RepID=UPI003F76B811